MIQHTHKSLSAINHINELRNPNHTIISVDIKKAFRKIQRAIMKKILEKVVERTHLHIKTSTDIIENGMKFF